MKIHVISTINGLENEGMRNVATHISRCFENEHAVVYSSLRDVIRIPIRCRTSDVTFIFARCVNKVYLIAKLCSFFAKKLNIVVVQRPDSEFVKKYNKSPIRCNFFTVCHDDLKDLRIERDCFVKDFNVGINTAKFFPVGKSERMILKKKYGVDENKPLILHVGHCSKGRGLEDFLKIDEKKYERLVVASGMFEDEKVVALLEDENVRIVSEYVENINEFYQMADVYFFPTRLEDFVISVPLSVMEALSCGTPVVAYKEFSKMHAIKTKTENAIVFIDSTDAVDGIFEEVMAFKTSDSLLASPKGWSEVANKMLNQGVV